MIIEKNCKSIKDILNNDIQVNGIIYSPIFGDLEYLGEDNGLKFRCIKSNNIVFFVRMEHMQKEVIFYYSLLRKIDAGKMYQ